MDLFNWRARAVKSSQCSSFEDDGDDRSDSEVLEAPELNGTGKS